MNLNCEISKTSCIQNKFRSVYLLNVYIVADFRSQTSRKQLCRLNVWLSYDDHRRNGIQRQKHGNCNNRSCRDCRSMFLIFVDMQNYDFNFGYLFVSLSSTIFVVHVERTPHRHWMRFWFFFSLSIWGWAETGLRGRRGKFNGKLANCWQIVTMSWCNCGIHKFNMKNESMEIVIWRMKSNFSLAPVSSLDDFIRVEHSFYSEKELRSRHDKPTAGVVHGH